MKNYSKTIVVASLMLVGVISADAQLNGLLKKAKNAVKEKVEKKVNDKVEQTVTSAVEGETGGTLSTIPSGSLGDYDPFKTYAPSAAAKKADPQASNNEVQKYYTKSPAAIRGAYEHLDKDLFPYQPYYNYMGTGLYLDGTQQTDDFILYITTECKKMINESQSKIDGLQYNGTTSIANTGKSVTWGEIGINAYFAQYLADPNSYYAYRHMIKAYIVAEQQFMGRFRTMLDEGSDTKVTNKDGKQTLFEPESARLKRNYKLMDVVLDVAMKSDYDNVFNSTYSMYTQAEKAYEAGNMAAALNNYREFVTSFEFFLEKHPGWAKDSRASEFTAMHQAARTKMQTAQNTITEESMEPVPMPKTYSVGGDIKKMAQTVIARVDPEHKNAPIYFLTSGWRPLTRNGFITHRAIDVAWEYKDAKGQRWLNHGIMMQQARYQGLTVIYIEGHVGMNGYGKSKIK